MDMINIFNTFSIGYLCYVGHRHHKLIEQIKREKQALLPMEQPTKRKVAEQVSDHEQRIEMLEMHAAGNDALEAKVRRAMNKMMAIEVNLNKLKLR